VRNDGASSGVANTSPGTVNRAAAASAEGLVTEGNAAATALGWEDPAAAAITAAAAPNPCPAKARVSGATLISPGPSRTPEITSSVAPRSCARLSTEGTGPRWVFGAAVTMPQLARCSRVPR
jgi:hypothetical protein